MNERVRILCEEAAKLTPEERMELVERINLTLSAAMSRLTMNGIVRLRTGSMLTTAAKCVPSVGRRSRSAVLRDEGAVLDRGALRA